MGLEKRPKSVLVAALTRLDDFVVVRPHYHTDSAPKTSKPVENFRTF
jgi:hypothetical protein